MKKKLMVVDDSRVLEMQMEKLLEGSDFQVAAHCKTGEEAIGLYGMVLPDVVTMDVIMPGLDGFETARAILEEHDGARIVMVTSLSLEDIGDELDGLDVKGVVCKPFERETLLDALEQAMA